MFNKNLLIFVGLTYELQLDKDKNPADQRLFFRETYKSIKKRHFKISNRICHDYSLYMKVGFIDKLNTQLNNFF